MLFSSLVYYNNHRLGSLKLEIRIGLPRWRLDNELNIRPGKVNGFKNPLLNRVIGQRLQWSRIAISIEERSRVQASIEWNSTENRKTSM